ncbi:hypothetical protein [Salinibius halmophilus]|uniref:hypothetical protein n=1 Tax=Salinibius halmophilus TaxID=1853216 RepID=UPI000E675D51|nr:hypothetical protein [Salinibius halmophilus]
MIVFIPAAVLVVIAALIIIKRMTKANIVRRAYGSKPAFKLIANPFSIAKIQQQLAVTANPDERYLYIVTIGRSANLALLKNWVEQQPNSPHANLSYGVRLAQSAWIQHFDSNDDEIGFIESARQSASFRQQVEEALAHLRVAAQQAPSDPTPFAFLITCTAWLGGEMDQYFHYYNKAMQRDSDNWGVNLAMVLALSTKWGGDNQHMLTFAEQTAKKAAYGSNLKLLPFKAYLEMWKSHQGVQGSDSILQDEQVRAQSRVWFMEWRQAQGSSHSGIFARYNALCWLWLIEETALAKAIYQEVVDHIADEHLRWTGLQGQLGSISAALQDRT